MTTTDDHYQFSMDDSISETPRTRSRNRKPQKKPIETTASKPDQSRVVTRSSQKSSLTPTNDDSFMSHTKPGFSQFVNPNKRQREEKKTRTLKKPKTTTYADENQPSIDEMQDIEQVKLVYETAGGRTNLTRAAVNNAQIVANRIGPKINTTFTLNVVDDTQTDTLAIPDTLANNETQHNDSSWQRDIDRLMKKLEEPSPSVKTQTQIEETQINEEEEVIGPIYPTQTAKIQTATTKSPITAVIEKDEIGIQTEPSQNASSVHGCCQDVSNCPCVLRYSKLERLFMEKMSRFISIVPTVPNSMTAPENHSRRRSAPTHSRFRRFRGHRRMNQRASVPPIQHNESTTVEQISDEGTTIITEMENPPEANAEIADESNVHLHPPENVISTTITIEKNPQSIHDLSSIEKLNNTTIVDHPSTLLLSSITNTCPTDRSLVLTTSSLDESQKSQFCLFLTRFNARTSLTVDSSTTHVIVNENSPLVCPLTGKIIQGIARHLFIVSFRWLTECLADNSLVDERPYEIRGDTSLGSDHGGMRRSRLTPSYLLETYSICLRCSAIDCAPLQTIEQVQELIELCGGKLVRNFSEIKTIDHGRQMILVLGLHGVAGGDKRRKALLDTCQQFNVRCVNVHWLLISIAKFDIQPLENYDINQV